MKQEIKLGLTLISVQQSSKYAQCWSQNIRTHFVKTFIFDEGNRVYLVVIHILELFKYCHTEYLIIQYF